MKVLYAIQGTGNGHISRAREIIRLLDRFCEFDLLISGDQHETEPSYPVKYRYRGLSMAYDHKGSVSFVKSLKTNNLSTFLREIRSVPVENYDLVINDFEPVTAWACKTKNVACISLSHQSALLSSKTPRKGTSIHPARLILKWYAPSKRNYGFHFKSYDQNIFPPLIRSEIRAIEPEDHGHYLVYLPAYSGTKLLRFFSKFKSDRFEIFVKDKPEKKEIGNCRFYPIGHKEFDERLGRSSGVICSAGFELPSEALYLGKKLLVVPIQKQYEQSCNALALKDIGVAVFNELKQTQVKQWLRHGELIPFFYHHQLDKILRQVFEEHVLFDHSKVENTSVFTSEAWLKDEPGGAF